MTIIERIASIYPDWQKLKLTKIGYSLQRQDAIVGLAQLYNSPDEIKHFDRTHFTATTIGGRVFLYCPVGNICSWAQGDVQHRWCEWCKKGFEELQRG